MFKYLFLSIMLFSSLVSAQYKPMQTDRPDFTEGAQTVENGYFQIESGYTFVKDKSTRSHAVPEFLLRSGLTDDLEFRFFFEGYLYEDDQTNNSGFSDISLGIKKELFYQYGYIPTLSTILEMNTTAGDSAFNSRYVEPEAKLLLEYDLGSDYSLSSNLNFAFPVEDNERYLELAYSLAIGIPINENFGFYTEYFGFYPEENINEETVTEHYLNSGFTYIPCTCKSLQFDIRVGMGLNSNADDLFSGLGVSYLF